MVYEEGDLMAPLNASICIPGVFAPVNIENRILVDGGVCNPVPYDLLDDCDVVIAVDVLGEMRPEQVGDIPKGADTVFGAFDLMQRSIVKEKIAHRAPDLYLRMPIHGIELFDFHKIEPIFEMAQGECDRLRKELPQIIEAKEKEANSWKSKIKRWFE